MPPRKKPAARKQPQKKAAASKASSKPAPKKVAAKKATPKQKVKKVAVSKPPKRSVTSVVECKKTPKGSQPKPMATKSRRRSPSRSPSPERTTRSDHCNAMQRRTAAAAMEKEAMQASAATKSAASGRSAAKTREDPRLSASSASEDVVVAALAGAVPVCTPPPSTAAGPGSPQSRPLTSTFAMPAVERPLLVQPAPSAASCRDEDVFLVSPLLRGRSTSMSRPSVHLIARAAANKPAPCPQTMWISLSSDDDESDAQVRTVPPPLDAVVDEDSDCLHVFTSQMTQPLQSPPPSSVLMRDVLPPTFRTRKAHIKQPAPPGTQFHDVDAEDASPPTMTQRLLRSPSMYHRAIANLRSSQSRVSALPLLDPPEAASPAPAPPRKPSSSSGLLGSSPAASLFTPNKYSDQRPVDCLKPLFPKTFTKEHFLRMVPKVVSTEHCLQPGEFWDAFQSIQYVGEGSFGLVWKCVTVDGDQVAVKSCPISFHSPEAIDDGFSVLREVAVQRFLNDHRVPYVLPLHNAFFVHATEALPPTVTEAICIKAKVEEEITRRKRRKKGNARGSMSDEEFHASVSRDVLSGDEQALIQGTRLPKFFAISELDALDCDATVLLVTELCDGDVEGIERSEAVSRGVAYCVSSALAEMHKLGLVHLDLKPSNILYALDNAPSAAVGQAAPAVKFYLSDFGNCHIVGAAYTAEVNDAVGTYEYMDTRALEHKICARSTDCFSLGCTLYELLTCSRLYQPCRNKRCGEDHERTCFVPQSKGPFLVQGTSILHRVAELLLAPEPSRRLTAAGCRAYLVNALGITSHEIAAQPTAPRGGPENRSAAVADDSAEKKKCVVLPLDGTSTPHRVRFSTPRHTGVELR